VLMVELELKRFKFLFLVNLILLFISKFLNSSGIVKLIYPEQLK
jgi:hypothetical protein